MVLVLIHLMLFNFFTSHLSEQIPNTFSSGEPRVVAVFHWLFRILPIYCWGLSCFALLGFSGKFRGKAGMESWACVWCLAAGLFSFCAFLLDDSCVLSVEVRKANQPYAGNTPNKFSGCA